MHMADNFDWPVIIDDIIRDVTFKVANLDLCGYDRACISPESQIALVTTVTGHYEGNIVFLSGNHVIRGISENMKHEQITQQSELELYTVEYFNILCGRIITAICNRSNLSARFNIPRMLPDGLPKDLSDEGATQYEWCYGSCYGPMLIRMWLKRVLN